MKTEKIVTFFMLVTNYDIYIADYSISSYNLLYLEKQSSNFPDFVLHIYANCISDSNKFYLKKWEQLPFVLIYDNTKETNNVIFKSTDILISPEGIQRPREGLFESCDEIWTNQLQKISTKYFATVDADFEILNSRFIIKMIEDLENNINIAVFSTDYDQTKVVFDTYLNENMVLSERWHTWFCIYRKSKYTIERSHYFYRFPMQNGMSFVYDSGAYLQNLIKSNNQMAYLDNYKYQTDFIHYGAFAKNKNLDQKSIKLYRKLAIYSKIGMFRRDTFFLKIVNYVIKKTSFILLKTKFQSEINERKYHH